MCAMRFYHDQKLPDIREKNEQENDVQALIKPLTTLAVLKDRWIDT